MKQPSGDVTQQAHYWYIAKQDQPGDLEIELAFKEWLNDNDEHVIAFAQAELFFHAMEQPEIRAELADLSPRPKKSSASLSTKITERFAIKNPFLWAGSIAFALSFLAISLLTFDSENTLIPNVSPTLAYSSFQENKTINLADGSQVTLAANSQIRVEITANTRSVELTNGAAFFSVAHLQDKPFTVTSGSVSVVVTGTEFDVHRHSQSVSVTVESGSVNVNQPMPTWSDLEAIKHGKPWSAKRNSPLTTAYLSAGEAVTASRANGLSKVKKVDKAFIAPWRNGQLVYIEAPLADVVNDMNRYSNKPISVTKEAGELKLSGNFKTDNIEQMLISLQAALPIEMRDSAEQISIAKK